MVLQQRHDQLPALVDAVRGLMAFERDVLTAVTRARAAWSPDGADPRPGGDRRRDDAGPFARLFATVERYPEIQSAANVLALQEEIERLEAMLADRRELYNDQVYRYNTRIAQVPGGPPRRALRLEAAVLLRRGAGRGHAAAIPRRRDRRAAAS